MRLKQDNFKMEQIKITNERENPLFKRKEVKISINSSITPSKQEIENIIYTKFSIDKETIAVKKVNSKFGSKTFIIDANIYSSREDKEKIEPKPKEKKK